MKIYTRTGDDGTTSLFSGGRVRKDHLRVDSYGTVDELNSHLGLARAHKPHPEIDAQIETVQNHLFHLGADLATPLDADAGWVLRMDDSKIAWLEESIDAMTEQLAPLKNFILPGGSLAAAQLHVARTVCRRAERLTVSITEYEPINPLAITYLNRLSDWLFTLARYANFKEGIAENKWSVR